MHCPFLLLFGNAVLWTCLLCTYMRLYGNRFSTSLCILFAESGKIAKFRDLGISGSRDLGAMGISESCSDGNPGVRDNTLSYSHRLTTTNILRVNKLLTSHDSGPDPARALCTTAAPCSLTPLDARREIVRAEQNTKVNALPVAVMPSSSIDAVQ